MLFPICSTKYKHTRRGTVGRRHQKTKRLLPERSASGDTLRRCLRTETGRDTIARYQKTNSCLTRYHNAAPLVRLYCSLWNATSVSRSSGVFSPNPTHFLTKTVQCISMLYNSLWPHDKGGAMRFERIFASNDLVLLKPHRSPLIPTPRYSHVVGTTVEFDNSELPRCQYG